MFQLLLWSLSDYVFHLIFACSSFLIDGSSSLIAAATLLRADMFYAAAADADALYVDTRLCFALMFRFDATGFAYAIFSLHCRFLRHAISAPLDFFDFLFDTPPFFFSLFFFLLRVTDARRLSLYFEG